jgi:hypothetical protein
MRYLRIDRGGQFTLGLFPLYLTDWADRLGLGFDPFNPDGFPRS